jgi:hypothetical protein
MRKSSNGMQSGGGRCPGRKEVSIDRRESAPKKLGDPALIAEAERALAAVGGDLEMVLLEPDGRVRSVSARQVLAEVEEDANALADFVDCVGANGEGST